MVATIPYTFAQTPNGQTIPLSQLDANFQYLINELNGPLTITPTMLSAGGPLWDATGRLQSQGDLVTGSGDVTSLLYPNNIMNIGLNGFTFNVAGVSPFLITSGGVTINNQIKMPHTTGGGTLTINPPNACINTIFTFPPDMGGLDYVLITDGNGNTSWQSPESFGVLSWSAGTTGFTPVLASTGNIVLAGTLNVGHGGTGLTTAPTNGQFLIGNGTGYTLSTLTGTPPITITNGAGSSTISLSGSVPVANGGTGLTAIPTNGQLLIGTGTGYQLSTLTPGANVSITNGSGSITINCTNATENYTSLRNLTPTANTAVLVEGNSIAGDGGGGMFYSVVGAAAGTYVDDNAITLVPIGGNGSSAWVRAIDGQPYNVKWFGATGNGVTDDAPAIQDALDAAVAAAKSINSNANQAPGVVLIPTGVYKMSTGIVVDSYNVSIEGYGWLDFTSLAAGFGIRITGTSTIVPWQKRSIIYGSLHLEGPGAASSVTGILFDTGGPAPQAQAAGLFENINVVNFGKGHEHSYLSYNSTIIGCYIIQCGYAVYVNNNNSGERVTYLSSTLGDSTICAVYNQICELYFYGCSFDNNFKIADVLFNVNFTDCHLEWSYQAGMTYMITVGPNDGAAFVMRGGHILPTGGVPTQAFINVLTTANRGGGASFDGVWMVGLGQTLGYYFSDGPGRITVNNSFGPDTWTCPYLLSANSNLLSDPNFTQFGTLPDAFIVNDTAPITNRLIGTNIQLAQVTVGAVNYLEATRGATTGVATASFALVAPLKGKCSRAGFKILVKSKTSPAPAGTINIFFGYCTLLPTSATNTVPTFGNGVFPQLATITPSDTTFSVEGTGQFTAPAYATHAVIYVQMGAWGANGNQLYFSAPEITEM